jgi:hypothetical protein
VRIGRIALLLLSSCWYQEATAPRPPDPGGTVTVQMDGGPERHTIALAHLKADPPVLDGASAEATVSITIGDDAAGADPKSALANTGGAVELRLTPTSRNHLEVHLSGTGCVAQGGLVRLRVDEMMLVAGDFQATGTVFGGSAACAIAGTLAAVPADR